MDSIPARANRRRLFLLFLVGGALWQNAFAQIPSRVVDIPTRPGVTQRFIYLAPENATRAVILFSGGEGILQISPNGEVNKGSGNFLVRSRRLFAERGLAGVERKELISFTGGENRGDPCHAAAHHGFNGLEAEVVEKIAAWVRAH